MRALGQRAGEPWRASCRPRSAPPSSEHSKVAPASVAEKANGAEVALVGSAGPVSTFAVGRGRVDRPGRGRVGAGVAGGVGGADVEGVRAVGEAGVALAASCRRRRRRRRARTRSSCRRRATRRRRSARSSWSVPLGAESTAAVGAVRSTVQVAVTGDEVPGAGGVVALTAEGVRALGQAGVRGGRGAGGEGAAVERAGRRWSPASAVKANVASVALVGSAGRRVDRDGGRARVDRPRVVGRRRRCCRRRRSRGPGRCARRRRAPAELSGEVHAREAAAVEGALEARAAVRRGEREGRRSSGWSGRRMRADRHRRGPSCRPSRS